MVEIRCHTGRIVQVNAESLEGVDLDDTDLHRAILHDRKLRGAKLRRANLRNADLRDADLRDADLSGAALMLAEFTGARLNGANMRGSRPIGADFRSANLQGADLTGADIGLAHLEGAVLRGARLFCARLEEAFLDGAVYDKHTVWPPGFDPALQGAVLDPRPPEVLAEVSERVLNHIKVHPGEGLEQIAVALGTSIGEVTVATQELFAQDKISASRQEAFIVYFPGESASPR